ncbi:MAG: hypothetical protein ACODAU_00310 [Myxococcota bacterium]
MCSRRSVAIGAALVVAAVATACKQPSAASSRASVDPGRGPAVVARIQEAHGDVRWKRAAAAAWQAAAPDEGLRPSDAVQTMRESRATIAFLQGHGLVRLGPRTTLRIPEQPPRITRLEHVSGRMVARLSEHRRGDRMEVQLPPGTLVLQADAKPDPVEAEVDVERERTRIAVTAGEAQLERRGSRPLVLREAHFVTLSEDGATLDSGRVGPSVQPLSPADGATVVTRGPVRFEWDPVPEVDGYRLVLQPAEGEPVGAEVPGDHTAATVQPPAGRYEWVVRGTREGEPLPAHAPRRLEVRIDRVPPELRLRSPAPGAVIDSGTVVVRGRTEPDAVVDVDGRRVDVGDEGHFATRRGVDRGLVNVVVRARDGAGNERVVSRAVMRE